MKNIGEKSLRFLVEKWLAPAPTQRVHVIGFGRTPSAMSRYVCVTTAQEAGSRALFFFRHADGDWKVFPPEPRMPAMATERLASAA